MTRFISRKVETGRKLETRICGGQNQTSVDFTMHKSNNCCTPYTDWSRPVWFWGYVAAKASGRVRTLAPDISAYYDPDRGFPLEACFLEWLRVTRASKTAVLSGFSFRVQAFVLFPPCAKWISQWAWQKPRCAKTIAWSFVPGRYTSH